jgi:hypothetical protein
MLVLGNDKLNKRFYAIITNPSSAHVRLKFAVGLVNRLMFHQKP